MLDAVDVDRVVIADQHDRRFVVGRAERGVSASVLRRFLPPRSARRPAAWIAGPSAIGSQNGMPISITSAPALGNALTISSEVSPVGIARHDEGHERSAALGAKAVKRRSMRVVMRGSLAYRRARGKLSKPSTSRFDDVIMQAMASVCIRSLSVRQFLFCAVPLLAALALSVAATGETATFAYATAGPRASPNAAQPMRFVRVRSDDVACRPNCPEWISAEGKIVTGSAEALERTLKAAGGRRLPIVINSAGGAVEDAMTMGRLIREKRLAVVVAHTTLASCAKGAKSCGMAKGDVDLRSGRPRARRARTCSADARNNSGAAPIPFRPPCRRTRCAGPAPGRRAGSARPFAAGQIVWL